MLTLLLSFLLSLPFDSIFTSERLRVDVIFGGNSDTQTAYLDCLYREPQWAGGEANLVDPFGYGQYKVEAFCDGQLVYSKGFNTLFEEWRSTAQAHDVSMSAGQSLWMPFPKRTMHLVISQRVHSTGRFESLLEFDVDPADRHIVPADGKGYKVVKWMENGPIGEKVDLVLVAEGYRKCSMRKFRKDADRLLNYFFSMEPYASRKSDFNVWLVESPSDDSGVTIPQNGVWKNTVIGSSFDTFYIDRYLTIMDHRRIAATVSGVPVDAVMVVANDEKYGGGGFYNSYAMTTSDHRLSPQVFIHEFGHSFAGLADEYYDEGATAYEDYYPAALEPWEPNITTLVDFGSKWRDMVEGEFPLANDPANAGVVSLFEGAGYMTKGCWRPYYECRMLNNTAPDFCPVCQRAISQMIDYYCKPVAARRRLPLSSGHRGADDIAPENTMASADSCIRYGVEVMECDVTQSSDGVFYLLHDRTLDRTTNGTGHAYDHPASYLDSLDAGSWFGPEWEGQHLLKFQDLLRRAYGTGLGITVDYRRGDFKDLVALIESEGMLARTNFTFSRDKDCIEFRRQFPQIKTLQAYALTIEDVDRVCALYSPNIIVCWIDRMDEAFVEYCHSRGLQVLALVLGLDDKTAQFARAVELGVDVIATDHPVAFRQQYPR